METLYHAGLSNAVSATVLAVAVACLARVLGRRPAILHCLWLLVLLKLITPSFFEVSVPWPAPLPSATENGSAFEVVMLEPDREIVDPINPDDATDNQPVDSTEPYLGSNAQIAASRKGEWSPDDWKRLAGGIWIAGIMTTLVVSFGRIRRFQLLLREAQPAGEDTQEWVDELAAGLGVNCSPSVWWIGGKLSPLIWSLGWRPRLILPTELWKGLDDHQRATLIIHELAHLRRGDHHLRYFELLVTALYWWHPVLWWARHALRDVEEQCCDAWVVWAVPGAARSYADTLLETLDFLHQSDLAQPLLASGFGKVQHLRKRLTMIMTGNTPRLLGVWGTLGSLGLAAVLLPVNATWAQKPEEEQEIRVVVKTDDFVITSDDNVNAGVAVTRFDELAEVVPDMDDASAQKFNFVFKTDGSASVISADGLDDAVKQLKQQIDEIDKKSTQSDKDKARKKALESALKELKSAAKEDDSRASGDKPKERKIVSRFVVRNDEDGKKLSAEAKVELDKAMDKVKELASEVRLKQKQLMEAKLNLSKLQGKLHTATVIRRVNVDAKGPKAVTIAPMGNLGLMAPSSDTVEKRLTLRRDDGTGQKRLDELEKKLEKLLDEVASLKKDRAK